MENSAPTVVPLWRREVTLRYVVKDVPRGVFRVGNGLIESGDLFGLSRVRRKVPEGPMVIVLPKAVPVRGWNISAAHGGGERRSLQHSPDDIHQVIGARPYEHGDRLSRIHWPVSARLGALQVKEFQGHLSSDVVVVPDCSAGSYAKLSGASGVFELAMQTAASLLRHAYGSGRRCGLVAAADPYVEVSPANTMDTLERCMYTLAAMEPVHPGHVVELLERVRQMNLRHAVLVVVSPRIDRDVAIALTNLQSQHAVQVFVPLGSNVGIESARLERNRLQAMGIDVHLIRSAADLSRLSGEGGRYGSTSI